MISIPVGPEFVKKAGSWLVYWKQKQHWWATGALGSDVNTAVALVIY